MRSIKYTYNKIVLAIILVMIIILTYNTVTYAVEEADTHVELRQSAKSGFTKDLSFTVDMLVITLVIIVAISLFLWETISIDIVAIAIPAVLVFLNPWTKITVKESLSGFSNQATITVLAMFILSEGIQRNGFSRVLSNILLNWTGNKLKKQLILVTIMAGVLSCFLNNTPIVATFIPVIIALARKTNNSPSKLLIPLSYASMMGGMMTLVGTSTNLLASEVSARIIGHPFSMFEFTKLGVLVFLVGLGYLFTLGHYLTPTRIQVTDDLTSEYELADYVTELIVGDNSNAIGKDMKEVMGLLTLDMDEIHLFRKGNRLTGPLENQKLQEGDHLIVRADSETLMDVISVEGLELLPKKVLSYEQSEHDISQNQKLIEVFIPHCSSLVGKNLKNSKFVEQFNAVPLAIRRGRRLSHRRLKDNTFKGGDKLLVSGSKESLDILSNHPSSIVIKEIEHQSYSKKKLVSSLGILVGVIVLAALEITSIVIAALAGVVAMVLTGCIQASEIYEGVNWKIVFLLAGLIPLGLALEKTGTAEYLAYKILSVVDTWPIMVVLGLFYLLTALLTNIISNNAAVVLMIPVAVNAAQQLGANPFAFVLAVTFAASTAFLTPIGYQTNLMVYGAGGYKFKDFIKVGAPLQILLALVTPIIITLFWSV